MPFEYVQLQQGSAEWLAFRKNKISATDCAAILGVSPWKTPLQLYNEKISDDAPMQPNERMQRGIDLEPIARNLFEIKTGIAMIPRVVVKDWAMASLDGMSSDGQILEIKCSGEKDHAIALTGKVPDHYYPQLQHQMYVCDVEKMYYFSFDGFDGVIVEVKKDNEYIQKMIVEEKKFYDCLQNRTPPESDYVERNDYEWIDTAYRWKEVTKQIKALEKEEQMLRDSLIRLGGESNCRGAGISLCQIHRQGNIDYKQIAELNGVDLEKYRKPDSISWRITEK